MYVLLVCDRLSDGLILQISQEQTDNKIKMSEGFEPGRETGAPSGEAPSVQREQIKTVIKNASHTCPQSDAVAHW